MAGQEKKRHFTEKPLILFAPLDWGLGHTIRSIPLIKALLGNGCKVIVACNSTQKKILRPEVPSVDFVHLGGYGLTYGINKTTTLLRLMLQGPKILIRIKSEFRVLKKIIGNLSVDGVISDNRYGFNGLNIPSVFLTHQLMPLTGLGRIADGLLQKSLRHYVRRFSECWVADFEKESNLAGRLSHPVKPPHPSAKYIGAFSRLENCSAGEEIEQTKQEDRNSLRTLAQSRLLILLSGPEPQRTILEKILLEQVAAITNAVTLVLGKPDGDAKAIADDKPTLINYANSEQLNRLICHSDLIVCRSGYTTVMDILKLRKRMIVIPTPGQAEQEYLGVHLQQQQLAVCCAQKGFNLQNAIQRAIAFPYKEFQADFEQYRLVITDFVERIKLGNFKKNLQ